MSTIKPWEERLTSCTTWHEARKAMAAEIVELRAENARLREAMLDLYITAPTATECRHFHHSKSEQRHPIGECGPAQNYLKSLEAARAALGES